MLKIKGFTIVELIIVLLISSLLIYFSLSILLNFNQHLKKIFKEQNIGSEILWFCVTLKNDIIYSDYITGNSETLKIYKRNSVKTYDIYPEKIIVMNTGVYDTIQIETSNVNVEHLSDGLINFVDISIKYEGKIYKIRQYKEYSVRLLFERMNENSNPL